jgi:hypothetical protein
MVDRYLLQLEASDLRSSIRKKGKKMNNMEIEGEESNLEEIFEELANDEIDENCLGVMMAYASGCW